MKWFTAPLVALVLSATAAAEAQQRFSYRPNYTARRQGIPSRTPSYSDYYLRNNNQLPPYGGGYSHRPSDSYRYSGGISDRYSWTLIYQYFNPVNGEQLLTNAPQNEDPYGMQSYVPDGMFFVSRTGGPGKLPLFRFYVPGAYHSYATERIMSGAFLEGILGYIDTRPGNGTVPLYGWYDPYLNRQIVSTSLNSELQNNFEHLGVLGYVRPSR